jgi:hypothetical protein
MKTNKLIAIFLAVFAIAAYAENATQLKTTIDNYVGCTGNLTTTVSGNIVTITDALKCMNNKILTLDINSDTRVVWKANFTGNVPNELIVKKGKGVLEIQDGSIGNNIDNSLYNAIRIDEGDLIISGGMILGERGYGVRNNSTGTVTITGGEISMKGPSSVAVYNASTGTVNIKGGTIYGYYAVYNNSTGTVNISGGATGSLNIKEGSIPASYCAVHNASTGTVNISSGTISALGPTVNGLSSGGTINISGGEISAKNGAVINSVGKITISPQTRITSK